MLSNFNDCKNLTKVKLYIIADFDKKLYNNVLILMETLYARN